MSSVRDRIVEALVAKLDGPGKPTGLTVGRFRTKPLKPPCAGLYGIDQEVAPGSGGGNRLVIRIFRLFVEIRVEGDPPDQQTDPIEVWVVKQVLSDPKLGGLCNSITEVRTKWSAEPGSTPIGAAMLEFLVHFQTLAKDPEAQNG